MPVIDRTGIEPYIRSVYPGALRSRTRGYAKRKLSDAGGITQFGFGEVTLEPGAATGLYHWHEKEDEVIFVLEGEVVLIEGGEEHRLVPGDCACFPAGTGIPHTVENRSERPARLIEIGSRIPDEVCFYQGLDMQFRRAEPPHFFTRSGRPFDEGENPAALKDQDTDNPKREG